MSAPICLEHRFERWPVPPVGFFGAVGGCLRYDTLRNFFIAVNAITISCELSGLTRNFTWSLLDPIDGVAGVPPGKNPSDIVTAAASDNVPANTYWVRRLMHLGRLNLSGGFSEGDTSLLWSISPSVFQLSDDGLYYVNGSIEAGGGSDDTSWFVSTTFGDEDVAELKLLDGSVSLRGSGDGASGSITIKAAGTW